MAVVTNELERGAWAGGVATAVMSAVFETFQRLLPMGLQPPKQIVESAAQGIGAGSLPEEAKNAATVAAHFGFGAGAGALFAAARPVWRNVPPVLSGIGYGLIIFGLSYKHILPSMGLMPRMEHDRPERVAALVAGHIVYGAVLGALLTEESRETQDPRSVTDKPVLALE